MSLLGPLPSARDADESDSSEGAGLGTLVVLGVLGLGLFKLFTGKSDDDLDGY